MTPLAFAAVAVLFTVCVCALAVLVWIASTDPGAEAEPRHLDIGREGQVRDARPSPDWLREGYAPRHALVVTA